MAKRVFLGLPTGLVVFSSFLKQSGACEGVIVPKFVSKNFILPVAACTLVSVDCALAMDSAKSLQNICVNSWVGKLACCVRTAL